MPDRRRCKLLIALTVLAAAGVYVVGNGSVSLWDRDEPRYAQCSRQMLQSGDWVVPRLYDEVRYAKPVFIYWCQAAAMSLLGDNAFAARLPSALAMPLTLALVGAFVWRAAGPARAAWAVPVLATAVLVLIAAKACLTDSVLLLWVTAAQMCLYVMWRGRGTWPVVLGYAVATAFAGLTKGPVVLGVQAMTMVALWVLERGARRGARTGHVVLPPASPARADAALKGVVALLVIAALTGPWLYLVERRVPGFLRTSISHDVVDRVRSGLENHTGPPGYYLATIWPFFLPWSLLLPLAGVVAWRHRHLPLVRFAMAAVLGPWLMFEIIRTKLPHYMLPTYPWLAILVADAIVRCLRGQYPDLKAMAFRVAITGAAVALILMGLELPLVFMYFGDPVWPALPVTLVAILYAAALLLSARRQRAGAALVTLGAGVAALWLVAWAVFLPRAPFLRLSIRVADVLKQEGATGPGQAVMLDYKEPTLAFYQGGTIRPNSAMELSGEFVDHAPRWIVTSAEVWGRAPQAVRGRLSEVGRQRGLAYADEGRVVEVVVLRKDEPGPQ